MNNSLNKIRKIIVLTTGGTIDKSYDESAGSLFNKESYIKNVIKEKLRLPYTEIDVHSILAKDSLDMTDEDRNLILKSVKKYAKKGHPIIITHGTDTMQLSAEHVERSWAEIPVSVIFTGAMRPFGVDGSDANQNIAESLYASQFIGKGVFISFHGRLYSVPGVRKNHQMRTFEGF